MNHRISRLSGVAEKTESREAPRGALLTKTGFVVGLALIGGRFVARTADGGIATTATTAESALRVARTDAKSVKTTNKPDANE